MGTVIIAAIVALVVILAVRSIYRDRRNGIGACGEKCSDCSLHCSENEANIPDRFKLKKPQQ